jgi:ribosomal protein S8
MVSNSAAIFSSIYNQGLRSRFREISVPNTFFCRSILFLLKREGFVLSYKITSSRNISVIQNHSGSTFSMFVPFSTRYKFLSYHKLKSAVNAGRFFILLTPSGYIFSTFAIINKLGGALVYELKKIN